VNRKAADAGTGRLEKQLESLTAEIKRLHDAVTELQSKIK
jgi:hypothetical protein